LLHFVGPQPQAQAQAQKEAQNPLAQKKARHLSELLDAGWAGEQVLEQM
jgi:hypothetical protein